MSGAGALVGACGALGVCAVLAVVLRRPPSMAERIAVWLAPPVGAVRPLRAGPGRPPGTPAALVGEWLRGRARLVGRLAGSPLVLTRRLEQAGSQLSVEGFREEQVLWAAGAAVGLGALAGLRSLTGLGPPAGMLVLGIPAAALAGAAARDYALSASLRRRARAMAGELPVVAELLALAVAAGEGPLAALARVAARTRGELGTELGRTLAEIRSGTPTPRALRALAARAPLPALGRFCEAFVVALERGTPLAEVLRAQAADARDAGRRDLLESGGRRELLMMVPVVFGILPVIVAFALFPGVVTLTTLVR